MDHEMSLQCRCGTLRGVARGVEPGAGNRVVCYCVDCQAFARFLGGDGIVDAGGGTDIFQMARGHVRITGGAIQLRCARLHERGMHRWFAGCCRTPVGNTRGPGVPFLGLILSFVAERDADRLARQMGRPMGIEAKFARGPVVPGAHPRFPPTLLPRTLRLLGTWWLTGQGSPSPFFDDDGQPVKTPHILTPSERASLDARPCTSNV